MDCFLKLQQRAQLKEQYNNDGIRNNYGLKFHGDAIIRYTFDY